jgi:hypothetical protein
MTQQSTTGSWNHPKIIFLLSTINKSKQILIITKVITAGKIMLLK